MASFGDNLRRERELRGVSLREIADATKISVRFLDALETDRLDVLPGGMFPRAFARQYALYLGLDVERTLASFSRLSVEPAAPPVRPVRRREAAVDSRRVWLRRAGAGGAVALIGVALYVTGVLSSRPRPVPTQPVGVGGPASAPTAPLPATPAPTPLNETGLTLELKAEQLCWVEVLVDGHEVLNRVLSAGETTKIEATQEIRLSVGNAGGLSLSVNNRPGLPLGRAGEVRRNIVITRESLPSLVQGATPGASSSSLSG
jgi:cytoskeleton protein RodZ